MIKFEGSLFTILFIVVVTMKIAGIVTLSWWLVLLPIYIIPVVVCSLWLIVFVSILIKELIHRIKDYVAS